MTGTLTASRLRAVLIIAIISIVMAMAGGFWFVHKNLQAYATSISKLNADSLSADSNIQTLQNLRKTLDEKQQAANDARNLIADSSVFPDRAVKDITRIAEESGVKITSIEYSEASAGSGTAAPTTPTTPTTPATPQAAATPAAPGVTKKTITVALDSPLPYNNLLEFIERIENNELKMQIASVSITKEKGDEVSTQPFSIGVYVR